MKATGGRKEFPSLMIDRACTEADIERNANILLPVAIQSFADMVLESTFVDDEDASRECMSLGATRKESEQLVLKYLVEHLRSAPKGDLDPTSVRKHVADRIKQSVVSRWGGSHHRN